MATGDQDGNVGSEPTRRSRAKRSGWPLLAMALVIAIIIWLLSQMGAQTARDSQKSTSSTSTIEVPSVTPTPTPAETPVAAEAVVDEAATVPSVVGYPRTRAVDAVVGTGYLAPVTMVFSTSVPAGQVVSQSPAAGEPLALGESVSLYVSKGRKTPVEVTMPSLEGLTQADAETRIKAAGLVPYVVYGVDRTRIGRVISQWPSPGASVPKGNEGFIQIALK